MTDNNIKIWNADVRWCNFSGIPRTPKDREGKRYINVILDQRTAEELLAAGWNVKYTKPKADSPDYEPLAYIKVIINFNLRQKPRIYLVTENNKTLLTEDTIDQLEGCVFTKVDLSVSRIYYRAYDQWSQVLNMGFFTIEEDELYKAYFDDNHQTPEEEDIF